MMPTRVHGFAVLLAAAIASAASAAPISSELLLAPAAFSNPSLSPDGKRIAAVVDAGHEQRALVIGDLGEGTFKPLLKTTVPGLVSVDRYEWATDDVLLLWIDVGAGVGDVWAVLDTHTRVLVQMKHEFARLVRAHWGDDDHVLVQELCTDDHLCLLNWNIRLNAGLPVAQPLPIASVSGFEVIGDDDIITIPASSGSQERQHWNPHARAWEPYGGPSEAPPASSEFGLAAGRARRGPLDVNRRADGNLYTSGSHQLVGYGVNSAPGLKALRAELEAPLLEVAKQLHGQQIHWLEISDDLATALISAHDPGAPESYYLWTRGGSLRMLQSSRPALADAYLPHVHVMSNWLEDGSPVSILPAAGAAAQAPVLIRPLVGREEIQRAQLGLYDGALQVISQHGISVISVPVPVGAAGGTGATWRQWAAGRLARVADHAVQMGLAMRDRICLWGEDFGGYAALSAATQPGYACVLAVNVPMAFDSLSKPLYSMEGPVRRVFLVSDNNVQMLHSLWVSEDHEDPGPADPIRWAAQEPSQVFLAFRTYGGATGDALKSDAAPFEAALRRAGKQLTLYSSQTHYDQGFRWNADLYDALAASVLRATTPH